MRLCLKNQINQKTRPTYVIVFKECQFLFLRDSVSFVTNTSPSGLSRYPELGYLGLLSHERG